MAVGLVFGYFVTLPAAEHFLTNYDNQIYNVQIQARPFISFATQVMVAMGIVFELPLFVVGLTRMGIIKTDYLRKNRRLCYFVVACIGVALPGVDPITTTVETVPLALLFEGSIWLSVLLDRRSQRMRAAAIQT
jgi:sec-independent protein translocase protein TatC